MSTTSGAVARTTATASAPFAASPDDVDVVLGIEQRAQPGPQQRLVVGQHDPDHRCAPQSGRVTARPVAPPDGDAPMVERRRRVRRRARACRGCRCPPPARRSPAPPVPSSVDLDASARPRRSRAGLSACRAPECRTTLVIASWTIRKAASSTAAGSGRTSPSTVLRTVETGVAAALDEAVERGERGRGRPRGGLRLVTQHSDEEPQLDQGLLACVLDGDAARSAPARGAGRPGAGRRRPGR